MLTSAFKAMGVCLKKTELMILRNTGFQMCFLFINIEF